MLSESNMVSVGAFEAKTHLSNLLERVSKGESITITRRGVPVARLVPVEPVKASKTPHEIMEQFRKFRESHSLDGITIRELIDEGRRY